MRADDKNRSFGIILFLTVLCAAAGITAGSVYFTSLAPEEAQGLSEYISGFASGYTSQNSFAVFKESCLNNFILWLCIFICGFFKIGLPVNMAVFIKRIFSVGFSAAAFLGTYGGKGFMIMLAGMSSEIIFIPALIMFCVLSARFSARTRGEKREYLRSYIFLSILAITIFCISSLVKGYITTIFMAAAFEFVG